MSTRLIIARHGNTFTSTEVVRRVGITDLPLVDSGLKQGYSLGIYLKNNNLIPDLIVTSNLKRTIQTAEEAQKAMGIHLAIETSSIFNEIDYGPDENQPEDSVVERVGVEALRNWETQGIAPKDWNIDSAKIIEHWTDFSQKLQHEYSGKVCLVVTSNGIARFFPYLTQNFQKFCSQYGIKMATGALSIFENDNSSKTWNCVQWNLKPK